jgi:type VI secretion system protein ImpL
MKKVLGILGNWWVLTLLAAAAAAIVLGFALPILWDQVRPLGVRLLLVGMVIAVWIAAAAWRIFTRRKAAKAIEETLSARAGTAEADATAGRMRDALAKLKEVRARGSNYLYDRPWYIIIGPPGAGKTTALLASGLQFPYSERALAGFGGTRNLDFWFADDAVFIDTAGRYTTQDSDREKDAAGWRGFLGELKKRRPLHPANGVLVAFPSDQLGQLSLTELDAHAAAVRLRLMELRTELQFELPVYVMFTKADMLPGFMEHFADLDAEGRRAVLGDTFAMGPVPPQEAEFAAAFDRVAQVVADRTARRLQDERDQRRRSAILSYQPAFLALRSRIVRFISGLAPADARLRGGVVRGLYFTSGVQGGSAVDMMAAGLGVASEARGDGAAPKGRAYFLNRLLREVVLTEPGMARPIDKAARRKRIAMLAGVGAAAALALVVISGTVISYFGNSGVLADAVTKAAAARQQGEQDRIGLTAFKPLDRSLQAALPYLKLMRALPGGYDDQKAGYPPLSLSFGLYQSQVGTDAAFAYREAVARVVVPRMIVRLREALIDASATGEDLYQPLKVYLTLAGKSPDAALQVGAIREWMSSDLVAQGVAGETRATVMSHVDAMLEAPGDIFRIWPEEAAPFDEGIVAAARARVQQVPLADRAVWLMRQQAASMGEPWRASDHVSEGNAVVFQNPEAVLALEAPFIFRKARFTEELGSQLDNIVKEVRNDGWVVGSGADARLDAEMSTLREDVSARYVEMYVATWDRILTEALKLGNLAGNDVALKTLERQQPPMNLLVQVVENTELGIPEEADAALEKAFGSQIVPGGALGKAIVDRLGRGGDPATLITASFRSTHEFMKGGKASPAAVFFDTLAKALAAPPAPGGGESAEMKALKDIAGDPALPAAAAAAADKAADDQEQGAASAAFKDLAIIYLQEIKQACQDVTALYPFRTAQNQPTIEQIKLVFGPTGFDRIINPLRSGGQLDSSGDRWVWSDTAQGHEALGISADALQRAYEIARAVGTPANYMFRLDQDLPPGYSLLLAQDGRADVVLTRNNRPVQWPDFSVGTTALRLQTPEGQKTEIDSQGGVFAILRLVDNATSSISTGGGKVTFDSAAGRITLGVSFQGKSPFGRSRNSLWSFTCPAGGR